MMNSGLLEKNIMVGSKVGVEVELRSNNKFLTGSEIPFKNLKKFNCSIQYNSVLLFIWNVHKAQGP